MDPTQGTIIIRPRFFFLSFLLYFFKPRGSINGHEVRMQWAANPFPVAPGRYQVAVWCPYIFFPRLGYSSVVVDVMPGAAVEVRWRSPFLVFLAGPISARPVDPQQLYAHASGAYAPASGAYQGSGAYQAPGVYQASGGYQASGAYQMAGADQAQPQAQVQHQAQAVGAGGGSWEPDPSGRHQYRWWDGTSWAPDVSDGGVTSRDPL